MQYYRAQPDRIKNRLTQWMIALAAIFATLFATYRGNAQEFSATELIAIREHFGTKISQRSSDQDEKELNQLRRISAVVGVLIDLQKQPVGERVDITKLSQLKNTDQDGTDEEEIKALEIRHLQLLAEVLVQMQTFLELHHSSMASAGIEPETKVASKSELTTTPEKIDWMRLWDREKSRLITGELTAIRDRAKLLAADNADLTEKQIKLVLALGKRFVDEQTEADKKTAFRTKGNATVGKVDSTNDASVSSTTEMIDLVDQYTALAEKVDNSEEIADESDKQMLVDELSQLHKRVEAVRQVFVSQRTSTVARERLLIYGLLNSQSLEISVEPSSFIKDLKETGLSDSVPLAALLIADECLSEAIDTLSPEKPKSIVGRFLEAAWSYELTFGEDASVTLGEILLLITSLSSAIFLSFVCSRLVGKYIVPWFGISQGAAIAWRLIIRNVLALLFTFVAFQLFGVPLTAFAFVGGAAALAVGFGSKDIANNFMSGLIILTEQPIRVNDVILYDSKQCLVTYIGLRSTRLRNLENHDLVVPNSVLIDRLVTNLTLTDKLFRLVLPIEVDRAENVERAISKMVLELRKLPSIHHEESPAVFLKSVDTYYLNFEIHVTVEFNDLEEINHIQSEVLQSISQLFPSSSDEPSGSDQVAQPEAEVGANEDDSTSSQTESNSGSTDQVEFDPPKGRRSWMKCSKKEIEHEIALLKQALKAK